MDEATLAWVRVEAAKAGQSVSSWLGKRLAAERGADEAAERERQEAIADMDRFLASPGWPLGIEKFDREEIYEERLRGLERRRLQPGPAEAGASGHRANG
ncbi:MAG: hypothetical protein IT546_05280 [Caulobacteraceae bacterium]|nr:hypothetical protein [Caulobacteraceae bacterium]